MTNIFTTKLQKDKQNPLWFFLMNPVKKTELVIFKHQSKQLDSAIKIKLNYKRLYPSKSVKYLGIKINENLNWKQHIHDITIKLNRANALLSI